MNLSQKVDALEQCDKFMQQAYIEDLENELNTLSKDEITVSDLKYFENINLDKSFFMIKKMKKSTNIGFLFPIKRLAFLEKDYFRFKPEERDSFKRLLQTKGYETWFDYLPGAFNLVKRISEAENKQENILDYIKRYNDLAYLNPELFNP